jgi:eukaryotic-like serine/threonine-protein kinase
MFVPFELVGQSLAHYQITEFIGRGPLGFVYRATDTTNQQTVTLKLFLKSSGEPGEIPEEAEKPFFEEARALRELEHPQVAAVLEVGETEGFRYICTEFVLGKSLDDLLNEQGALPLETALPLFRQVLSALQAAYEKNIIHRNLKPANILIQRNGWIKITDFGQAKIPSMAATVALTGAGSPFYMSPEAILGQRGDIRSDIYSVGTLLYRVLTGEKPFDGESTATIVQRVVQQDPTSPKLINPHIPEELGILCTKAMAKDPAKRFQTPQEMLDALTAFQPLGSGEGSTTLVDQKIQPLPPRPLSDQGPEKPSVRESVPDSQASSAPSEPVSLEETQPISPPTPSVQEKPLPRPAALPGEKPATEIKSPRSGPKTILIGSIFFVLLLALILVIIRLVDKPGGLLNPSIISPTAPPKTPLGLAPIGPLTAPTIPPSSPSAASPRGTDRVPSPSQVEQLLQQAKTVWSTNMGQAQTLLEQAVVLAPQNFEVHFQLGRLLTQKQQYPAAIQEYQQALNINNRIPEAYFNLGYIHLIQGNYDLAIQHLEWCRALSPPYQDEVLTNIGIVYLRKKNSRQARSYFQEASRLNPRNTVARDYLKKMEAGDKDRKKKDRHD